MSDPFYNGGLTHGELSEETFGLFIRPTLWVDTPPGNGSVIRRLNERQGVDGWVESRENGTRLLYLDAESGIDCCWSGALSQYSLCSELFIGSRGAKGPFSIKL